MTTSTRQLITGALRLIGVVQANESPTPEDMEISVSALDALIDSWSNNRLMIYTIKPRSFPITGSQTYTLGPGGDWDITRPMNIENAYARLNAGSAQQLDIAMQSLTDAQYAGISVKNTSSTFPFAFYDDGAYPLRTITLFPIPNGQSEIVLWLREPLIDLVDLDQPVMYPPGYERAFRFNLAVELAAEFGKTLPTQVIAVASVSKLELERLNSVPRYLHGDSGMSRTGKGRFFNYITGGFWKFGSNN
jgi:hypothetical protein